MKHLIALQFMVTSMVLLFVINYYVDNVIPQFTIGFISCGGMHVGYKVYKELTNKE